MEAKEIEQMIREYLPRVIHMSLATVGAPVSAVARPWVCEVHVAYDDDLHLYWISSLDARHSRAIAANARVAGNIVVQHRLGDTRRCVSFEGTAEVVQDISAEHPAFRTYVGRFPDAEKILGMLQSDTKDALRIYKLNVSDYYMSDDERTNGRLEKYHLPWNNNQ